MSDRPLTPALQQLIQQASTAPALIAYPEVRARLIMLILARDVDGLEDMYKEEERRSKIDAPNYIANWTEHCRDVVRIDLMREEKI